MPARVPTEQQAVPVRAYVQQAVEEEDVQQSERAAAPEAEEVGAARPVAAPQCERWTAAAAVAAEGAQGPVVAVAVAAVVQWPQQAAVAAPRRAAAERGQPVAGAAEVLPRQEQASQHCEQNGSACGRSKGQMRRGRRVLTLRQRASSPWASAS